GKYLFTDLADGTYRVCFDIKNLPGDFSGYTLTTQNAAEHNGTDSAADQTTGCTEPTTLGIGHREDWYLDAGLVAPPNTIGDYVWYDTDKSGLQDAGEPGVPNVPVVLVDNDGKTIASVKTDPSGKYLFENVPDGKYRVCFDLSALDGPYTAYVPTKPGVGGHNGTDSAVDPATRCTELVKVGVGHRSELAEDLGIIPPVNRLGDYVWKDANGNGVQDAGEPPLADVPVTLKDGTGAELAVTKTGPDGKYLFTDLPDGTYQVCFPVKDVPGAAGYSITKVDAAGRDGTDSAADPTSGCTRTTDLAAGHREDFSLDAGYVVGKAPAAPVELSYTGAAVGGLLALALLLLGGGGLFLFVSRRRRVEE
ncbi:MAG: SdrD B-like domain-containing protein, partial [Umezawaea sp.]